MQDLTISAATLSGDPEFAMEGPLKTTLKGKETTFIRVVFTPKAEKVYMGSIVITSNAEENATTKSTPSKTIGLSGRGFKKEGGG